MYFVDHWVPRRIHKKSSSVPCCRESQSTFIHCDYCITCWPMTINKNNIRFTQQSAHVKCSLKDLAKARKLSEIDAMREHSGGHCEVERSQSL